MIGLFMTQPTSTRERTAVSLVAQETAELRPLIRSVIASMLHESREHPDVEDCTHEVLRRALEGSTRLRDGEPLRPWVTGIARHVALDALRSRKRQRLRSAVNDSDPEDGGPSTLDRVADDAPSPHDRVSAAEQARVVRVALDRLPEGQREALRLFHLEELGYPEIARRLDVPLGTVATWISRARKAMAESIVPERSPL